MMNKDFEELPEIKRKLISVNFNEKLNRYESKNPTLIECFETALYLNGALYAYQEQQKRIDTITELMDDYYTGSFSPIGELAGEISAVSPWDED